MAASTHKGHCQACGRLQMLPKGRLSKHGYTVEHGYFSGVCRGARELPFEQSCDLVKQFIVDATNELQRLTKFQTSLRRPAIEPKAWFRVYRANPRGHYFPDVRYWEEHTIREEVVRYEGGQYSKFWRKGNSHWTKDRGPDNVVREVVTEHDTEISAGYHDSILDVATKHNQQYADWLEAEAKTLRRYISWQQWRVDHWKPAPLLPVSHTDKEGFEPTAAAY